MGPDADLLTLDFLLVSPSLANVWSERELYAWNGRTIKTVSRQGLGAMKRLAGRPQDIADLSALEGQND
jgi:hypothetical protein